MGTIITLEIEGLDVTWSKNRRGPDHGSLFQAVDNKLVGGEEDEAPDDDPEDIRRAEKLRRGFARTLGDIVPRLELLGFTIERARRDYAARLEEWREEQEAVWDDGEAAKVEPLSFEEFRDFATRYPVASLDNNYDPTIEDDQRQGRFSELGAILRRVPRGYDSDDFYSERSFFAGHVNIIHPYSVLRLLAGNEENMHGEVVWHYGDLVDAGWAKLNEFLPSARRRQTFLIATEGTSDGHILEHAFRLLRPGIADFFKFIDVTERHPFSGTGNLVKFAEGLIKIDVQNNTLFVFDNDAEGAEARAKLDRYRLPSNMRAMLLPDLDHFRSFPCSGPNGEHLSDINGKAAAIECYLDHRLHRYPPPRVIWTNFRHETGIYQGALEHKDTYTKAFLKLRSGKLGSYDVSKLEKVLDAVVAQCTAIALARGDGADQGSD